VLLTLHACVCLLQVAALKPFVSFGEYTVANSELLKGAKKQA
jgi:hypothetical protein